MPESTVVMTHKLVDCTLGCLLWIPELARVELLQPYGGQHRLGEGGGRRIRVGRGQAHGWTSLGRGCPIDPTWTAWIYADDWFLSLHRVLLPHW